MKNPSTGRELYNIIVSYSTVAALTPKEVETEEWKKTVFNRTSDYLELIDNESPEFSIYSKIKSKKELETLGWTNMGVPFSSEREAQANTLNSYIETDSNEKDSSVITLWRYFYVYDNNGWMSGNKFDPKNRATFFIIIDYEEREIQFSYSVCQNENFVKKIGKSFALNNKLAGVVFKFPFEAPISASGVLDMCVEHLLYETPWRNDQKTLKKLANRLNMARKEAKYNQKTKAKSMKALQSGIKSNESNHPSTYIF